MALTLEALRATVQGSLADGQFVLPVAQLQSGVIDQLAPSYLAAGSIWLNEVGAPPSEVRSDDGSEVTFTLSGQGADTPFKGLATTVAVVFTAATGEVRLRILATASTGWDLAASFPSLAETVLTDLRFVVEGDRRRLPRLSLRSHEEPDGLPPGLAFAGTLDVAAMTGGLSSLLGASELPLSGSVTLREGGTLVASMSLLAEMDSRVDLGIAAIDHLALEVGSQLGHSVVSGRSFPLPYVRMSADIPFTAHGVQRQIPVAARLAALRGPIRFSLNLTDGVDALLDEVAALADQLGLSDALDFRAFLPSDGIRIEDDVRLSDFFFDLDPSGTPKVGTVGFGIETTTSWEIFTTASGTRFTIDSLRLGFGMVAPFAASNLRMLLHGEVGIGEKGTLILDTWYPEMALQLHLKEGTSLSLGELCTAFVGSSADVPPLAVDVLELDYHAGSLTLDCNLEGMWGIPGTNFYVEDLRISIAEAAGVLNEALLSGQFRAGTVDVSVTATYPEAGAGWQFQGGILPGGVIDLTELVLALTDGLGLSPPEVDLPEITLSDLQVSFNTQSKAFTFQGSTDVAVPAVVQLGTQTHDVRTSVYIASGVDPATQQRTFQGFLRGQLTLGTAAFELEWDFGAAEIVKGVWDGTSGGPLALRDLAGSHGIDHGLQAPGGADLALSRAAFEFDLTKSRFLLSADSVDYGEAFFLASDANQTWDFAFGVVMAVDQIPGFPSVGPLRLAESSIILSTVRDDNFTVPSLPGVPPPPGVTPPAAVPRRTFPAVGTTAMPLTPGVSVAALLDLDESSGGSVILANAKQAVGQAKLLVQAVIADPIGQSSFRAYLSGALTLAGAGETKLVLSNVYVQFQLTPLGVLLSGSVLIPIDAVTVEASGALVVTAEEMQAIFDVKAEADGQPAALPFPFGLLGVRLDELAVAVGMIFEPPGVDLGLEGRFNIVGAPVGTDQFVVVLELEEEIPNPLYLSVYMASLSVRDLITAATGETVSDLPDIIGAIRADDLMVYWSETPGIVLPDRTVTQAGFGFNGIITVGTFSAHARLQVSSVSGVSGDAEMSPVDWHGVLSVKGDGAGVKLLQENVDGQWQTVRKPQGLSNGAPAAQTREYQVIPPGGATFAFNTRHSPYIDVSMRVSLFNLADLDVEVVVANDGFTFKLDGSIGSAVKFQFDCTLNKSGFKAHAEFDLDIAGDVGPIVILGVDLGTISLDVSLAAVLDVAVDSSGFTLGVAGKFWFDDHHLDLPKLTLHEDFHSLEELPGKILGQIRDFAEDLFKDVFDEAKQLLQDAEAEAKQITDAIAGEVSQIAGEAEHEAQRIADAAQQTYESVAAGIADAEAEAQKLESEATQLLADAAAEVRAIVGAVEQEVAKLDAAAQKFVDDAAGEVAEIERVVSQEVAQLDAQAKQLLDDAADEARRIAAAVDQEVDSVIAEARKVADSLVADARALAQKMEDEAKKILDEIAAAAKSAVHWVEKTADDAWHAIKKY